MKSASSAQAVPVREKLSEALSQFKRLLERRAPWKKHAYNNLEADFEEYSAICQSFGFALAGSKAFEIGCGQRPYRLFYLLACGVDARALDLDRVLIRLSTKDIFGSLKDNGVERAVKTIVRHCLFDQFENRQFRKVLSDRAGATFPWSLNRISRGSASEADTWPSERFDFIYSEDVLEHIPKTLLPMVCDQMAEHLKPGGVAMVRPMIYTGIQGGHHVEWYDADKVLESKRSEPWDHLRGHQHRSNTFLNRVSLAEYREIFSARFEIVEERFRYPELGRELLTPKIRDELSQYSEEDLFANQVAFILRPC